MREAANPSETALGAFPTNKLPIDPRFSLSDKLWEKLKPLLPAEPPKPKGGRPRMDDRQAITAILYVLRTGIQWNALPRSLGASSTVHDRFQYWEKAGVFRRLWEAGLQAYDEVKGIEWTWQAMDGAMTKAPLGGKRNRSQSHRPRQDRNETQSPDRRPGDTPGPRR